MHATAPHGHQRLLIEPDLHLMCQDLRDERHDLPHRPDTSPVTLVACSPIPIVDLPVPLCSLDEPI